MAINPDYIASSVLQQELIDKDSGLPLAGGMVYFYQDDNRTTPKSVYTISGDPPNYSFTPLPNPVILSAIGTFQDADGNDIIPYYYPFDADGNLQLYYVAVFNAEGVPQFTREAWPPNASEGAAPELLENIQNIIPNGQFLLHNTITPNNQLSGGTNIIAPGGWTFELPMSPASTNFLVFTPILTWTENPPDSPPWEVNVQCTSPSPSDNVKSLRIKFNDVNKFSNDNQLLTFGFAARSTVTMNVNVNIVKYFGVGGTVFTPVTVQTITIAPSETFFSVTPFSFGNNAGDTIGTGQTYVAIDIAFNPSISFNATLTDFVLVEGEFTLPTYPTQTNADTVTRSLYGWTDLPAYDGSDLYLPPIVTAYGMTFDKDQIGEIGQTVFNVLSPNSTDPIPQSNRMPCDGSSYLFGNYAANGIPFYRLGDELIAESPVATIPLFGTGPDFATSYIYNGALDVLRLTVNTNGTGIAAASDGNTGWTIGGIVLYNNIGTGSASIGYSAYSNVANTILAVGNFVTPFSGATAGTSGFTVTTLDFTIGLLAQQFYALTVICVAASALANPSAPADYWLFSNSTTNYYMWFQITNETDPAVAGRTGIKINLESSFTAQDVANIVREAMNAYQISDINISSTPTSGQYWLFSTNPASVQNYYVWYNVNNGAGNPLIPGRIGIEVNITTPATDDEIAFATQEALNSYQYMAPNFEGVFLRGLDPSGTWDKDVAYRWSAISGLSGANIGTFEFQQFLSHYHATGPNAAFFNQPAGNYAGGGSPIGNNGVNISLNTGGSETRPVNAAVNYFIRY